MACTLEHDDQFYSIPGVNAKQRNARRKSGTTTYHTVHTTFCRTACERCWNEWLYTGVCNSLSIAFAPCPPPFEHLNVGGVFFRSMNGAPSPEGRVVKYEMAEEIKNGYPPPPPPALFCLRLLLPARLSCLPRAALWYATVVCFAGDPSPVTIVRGCHDKANLHPVVYDACCWVQQQTVATAILK